MDLTGAFAHRQASVSTMTRCFCRSQPTARPRWPLNPACCRPTSSARPRKRSCSWSRRRLLGGGGGGARDACARRASWTTRRPRGAAAAPASGALDVRVGARLGSASRRGARRWLLARARGRHAPPRRGLERRARESRPVERGACSMRRPSLRRARAREFGMLAECARARRRVVARAPRTARKVAEMINRREAAAHRIERMARRAGAAAGADASSYREEAAKSREVRAIVIGESRRRTRRSS